MCRGQRTALVPALLLTALFLETGSPNGSGTGLTTCKARQSSCLSPTPAPPGVQEHTARLGFYFSRVSAGILTQDLILAQRLLLPAGPSLQLPVNAFRMRSECLLKQNGISDLHSLIDSFIHSFSNSLLRTCPDLGPRGLRRYWESTGVALLHKLILESNSQGHCGFCESRNNFPSLPGALLEPVLRPSSCWTLLSYGLAGPGLTEPK